MAEGALDPRAVADSFALSGDVLTVERYGTGHIHDTYLVACGPPDSPHRYILQRINRHVFFDPCRLTEGIQQVTRHIHNVLSVAGVKEVSRCCLQLVGARDGKPYFVQASGEVWRVYRFIEGSVSHSVVETKARVHDVARAFAQFQSCLLDLDPATVPESIADFHHTPKRFSHFKLAVAEDRCQRVERARAEVEFALARESMVGGLLDLEAAGDIPRRLAHNDAKLDNLLFDRLTK